MNVYKTLYFVEIRLTSHSTVIILIPGLAGQSFKMVKTNFGFRPAVTVHIYPEMVNNEVQK